MAIQSFRQPFSEAFFQEALISFENNLPTYHPAKWRMLVAQ
jgi:hypothetical protein